MFSGNFWRANSSVTTCAPVCLAWSDFPSGGGWGGVGWRSWPLLYWEAGVYRHDAADMASKPLFCLSLAVPIGQHHALAIHVV
jgi:hypothetical protein